MVKNSGSLNCYARYRSPFLPDAAAMSPLGWEQEYS